MSFPNKGFWMAKEHERMTEGDTTFNNSSQVEHKRTHQWFEGSGEPQLFPNKKQAVQPPDSRSTGGFSTANFSTWANSPSPGFQSVQNQFMDRLFGSETSRSVGFVEKNVSSGHVDETTVSRKVLDEQYGDDASIALSISHAMEDSQTCLSYGGIRKVRVNQVKDHESNMHAPKGMSSRKECDSDLVISQVYARENETSFISMGDVYNKEDNDVTLAAHASNRGDEHLTVSLSDTYNKGDTNIISFGSLADEHNIIPVGQSVGTYDQSYNQYVQTSQPPVEKELTPSDANAAAATSLLAKSKPEPFSKPKIESKPSRKEAPNSFPSNVRSLISTGMLDGVPVKYVSLSREEQLCGIIKGSGYLCGCKPCNYSKVLNAYEFERHANCKTKHPNNHIYFDNGKTIYQIVQELRSTPESSLFDAIQNAFGSPINQKAFRNWKESFQAATRELQRIYGKEFNS